MLTMVEVRTAQGDLLNLPLADASSGLIVDSIEGLDPVKATIVSSSFANLDGAQYHSSRRETRNITLRIALEPDYVETSVQDLRHRLYSFFMPKSVANLRFIMSDGQMYDITGRVESLETALFSKEPAVDISLLCFDPDFYDPVSLSVAGSTTSTVARITIDYEGSIETGILFTLNVNRTLSEFTIYHNPPDGSLVSLDFAGPLVAGDVLRISTVAGNKGVTLTHLGVETSMLYAISPQSKWIELLPGQNLIRVYATGAAIPYTIEYTDKYGGL
jgi:hypothetical protein